MCIRDSRNHLRLEPDCPKLFLRHSGHLLDLDRLKLGAHAKLGGFEGVLLRHRVFGAVDAVEHQLAEVDVYKRQEWGRTG